MEATGLRGKRVPRLFGAVKGSLACRARAVSTLDRPSTPRHGVDNRHKEALCAPAPAKKAGWGAEKTAKREKFMHTMALKVLVHGPFAVFGGGSKEMSMYTP